MAKQQSDLQFSGFELDADSDLPMYRQLYNALRQAILAGRLRAGQRLPATRVFASQLGVSRNTVLLAFDHLLAEGYLNGKTGSGTYVTDVLPEALLHARQSRSTKEQTIGKARRISQRGQVMAGARVSSTSVPEEIQPFQPGLPALNDFPHDLWARIVARQLRILPRQVFGYGDPAGYRPLRAAIAAYLRTARAVRCETEQVIIVNGSQQALDLTARLLLDPGETAWIEDPGYMGAKGALIGAGVKLVPVAVDEEGLNVEQGVARDPHAGLVYVSPSHQYPLGVTMSLSRRLQLLEWANRSGAWILEDDYDSEYRYAGRPLSSLQGLDVNERVIYLGTFSKVLFPALRLGYLVVPPDLIEPFVAAKALADRNCSLLEQAALAEFIEDGHFGRHIRRMRLLYQHRQKIFIEAVKHELDDQLTIRESEAGLHVVGWLPNDTDEKRVAGRTSRLKLTTPPLSLYTIETRHSPGLILGYAAFDEKAIRDGVRRLAQALG